MVTFNIQMGHPDRLVALRKGDVINVIGKVVGDIDQGEGIRKASLLLGGRKETRKKSASSKW